MFQKCLIPCNKILIKVLHNMSLKFCYHGNILGSRPPQNKWHFWPASALHFHIFKWCLACMIPQAYKYVSSSLWPRLAFFELKIVTYWNRVGGYWKRVSCHGNKTFIAADVFPVELLACKFQWSALQIGQDSPIYFLEIILGGVYDIISYLICIFCTFFKLKYLRN